MHSAIALYQRTQCLLHGQTKKYKGALCIVEIHYTQLQLSIVHGRSAYHYGQIRIMHVESAPYHRGRCIVSGLTT